MDEYPNLKSFNKILYFSGSDKLKISLKSDSLSKLSVSSSALKVLTDLSTNANTSAISRPSFSVSLFSEVI
jgi:hypothetical protein